MHTTKIIATGLAALLGLATMALAAPASTGFSGSRADVRAFCKGEGYHLIEGGSFSFCATPLTDVFCRDDNVCASSDFRLALEAGFQRVDVASLAAAAV